MLKGFFKDTLRLIIGSTVFAAGFCIFALPAKLLTGGAGGAAAIIYELFGLPVGTGILIINLPLFIAAFMICGRDYTVRTFYSTVLFSIIIDIFEIFVKIRFEKSALISALAAGLLTGIGVYILISHALVTGGSDLLAYLIKKKNPKKALGTLIFIIDGIVVIAGAFIYKSIKTALYSILLIAVMSSVLTLLMEKKSNGKLFKRHNRH